MAGIDNIVGQVLPCQEETSGVYPGSRGRDGHFIIMHLESWLLPLLHWNHRKRGVLCARFWSLHGWSEGVQLEKHLLDHFLVRGINHFVPHAFSAKAFPDPDCPPHFLCTWE